jgi:hypothetical protein
MTGDRILKLFAVAMAVCCCSFGDTVSFAENGSLKMLYDNRMYPQALEHDGTIYMVWRGEKGLPYIRSYDPSTGEFSDPFMLLEGRTDGIDAKKYASDHHFAPVVWVDVKSHLHVLFGCHNTAGTHLVSARPNDIAEWTEGSGISEIMSYPKVHRIYDGKTLVYFRYTGHLGFWTYRVSDDDCKTWTGPDTPPVDLNVEPHTGYMASHAGSYHTTAVTKDGRTLHVGFIWKVEDPVPNKRYGVTLGDHTQRYNLYYVKVDLPTGKVYNYDGSEMPKPVDKKTADEKCIVWDTDERVAAVGPSIYLDENDEPHFLLPVSAETPHKCWFYFVKRQDDGWKKTRIARTPHPFNSSHLDRTDDGFFRAFLTAGEGEAVLDDESEQDMNAYGWGERIEEWVADKNGENWKLLRDISPAKDMRYQNIQPVWRDMKDTANDTILFYGWQDAHGPGTAYLATDPKPIKL